MQVCGTLFSDIIINIIFLNIIICGSTIWQTIWSTHNLILTYKRNILYYLQEYCFAVLFGTVMAGKDAAIGWQSGATGVKSSGTKAQKHRISDQIWKGPLDDICSNLPSKARSLTLARTISEGTSKPCPNDVFEHLKEWRLHNLPGLPVLGHPHSRKSVKKVEKCSLIFRGNLLSFSFCSLSPVSFTTLNHSCTFFAPKLPELVICVSISGLVAHPKASECYSLRNRVPTWNLCAKLRSNLITLEPDFSKMKMITVISWL